MAIPMQRLGGRAFAHTDSDDDETEREYDRLRDLARQEAQRRNACFERSQEAYKAGDGAAAKELSNEGKRHAAQMDAYNQQASDFIFRANNAPGEVGEDEIDLHGQFVEEAERILEARVHADRRRGASHLYAIVGKGNHSANGVQRIRPAVERLCGELGLRYATDEDNTGRILINLQGGEAVMPPPGQQQSHHHPGHGGHQQPQQGEDDGPSLLGLLVRKLEKNCCIVM
ncbi:DUF1771-domain-containing protein [Sodiomyces alkalinus F11]|uniref:DUF1771-domain-containing protein n=1 Tax=Sodiomyces alkalinus (strain CBS 110278 / VKM F-3762 / F11) TaxID=1314773 RepID=A0A3N2Q829_SODAK|nr:DUF1771-domain-containing protein [Sodiomyces alkalinus F11]ROT42837.1 DUF1771-domain-containing protein [Sodiomyces alkalinus F11]